MAAISFCAANHLTTCFSCWGLYAPMFLCIYLFTICRLMLLLLLFVCAGWYPVQHQVYVYCTCICIFFLLFFYIVVCVAGRYPVQYHYGLQRLGVRRQEGGRGGLHQSGKNFSLSETISSDFFVLIYKNVVFAWIFPSI